MAHNTCDLYDRFEDRARVPALALRDCGARRRFAGRGGAGKWLGENSRRQGGRAEPGEGRVIVVDAAASLRCALVGDMIAADLARNGWAGVVINGCVRDVVALRGVELGIKALASTPRKSVRRGEGQVEIPLSFGGVEWRPGEVLFADEDGVLTLSADDAAGVG